MPVEICVRNNIGKMRRETGLSVLTFRIENFNLSLHHPTHDITFNLRTVTS